MKSTQRRRKMFIVRLFAKLLLKVLKWLQGFVDQSGLY
nr:MAG TPA: hypothetical protein [Caudoviricetes sp.]